jgi:hypothetical protein
MTRTLQVTDSRGRYRFNQFDETGHYSIQVSADSGYTSDADEPIEFLVSKVQPV